MAASILKKISKVEDKLDKGSRVVDRKVRKSMLKLGLWIGNRPYVTLLVVILVVGGLSSGIAQAKQENRAEELWIPQNTQALRDFLFFSEYFEAEFRLGELIFVDNMEVGNNVFSKESLLEILAVHLTLSSLSATEVDGETGFNITLDDICLKDPPEFNCRIINFLEVWDFNQTLLLEDNNIHESLLDFYGPDLDNLISKGFGDPLIADDGTVTAQALKLTYYIENREELVGGELVDPISDAWQLDVFEGACLDRNDQGNSSVSVECFVFSDGIFSEIAGSSILGDLFLVSMGLLLFVVIFGSSAVFNHKGLLGLGGLFCIGMGIAVAYGLTSYFGVPITPMVNVLPFLLLGIGVDNLFIINSAFAKTPVTDSPAKRLSLTLEHAGSAITVTSLTDFLAFMIGSTTSLYGLRSFCYYASVGIVANYLIAISAFSSFIILDTRCFLHRRPVIFPCQKVRDSHYVDNNRSNNINSNNGNNDVHSNNNSDNSDNSDKNKDGIEMKSIGVKCDVSNSGKDEDIENKIAEPEQGEKNIHAQEFTQKSLPQIVWDYYTSYLLSRRVRIVILVIFFAFLVVGILGIVYSSEEFKISYFIPNDSETRVFIDLDERYFDVSGSPLFVVTQANVDIYNNQDELLDLYFQISQSEYVFQSIPSWLEIFNFYILSPNITVTSSEEWHAELSNFLETPVGKDYARDIVWTDDSRTQILTTRKLFILDYLEGTELQVQSMRSLQEIAREAEIPAFSFSFDFVFFEQFAIIGKEAGQNIGLSALAIFVVTLVLIHRLRVSFLVFLSVGLTLVDIFGVMWLWNITINAVSIVNLVFAVGLAVDYSAHVGYAYVQVKSTHRSEKTVNALKYIGQAVLNGIFSTFLAVIILAFSTSFIFITFFKMVFSICLLGGLHGLVFLPVLLILFGPVDDKSEVPEISPQSSNLKKEEVPKVEEIE